MFENSFVISLKSTPERLAGFNARAERAGLRNIAHFPAITTPPKAKFDCHWFDGRRGAFGCYMSHSAVIRMAYAMNFDYLCVFEDDAEFVLDFKKRAEEMLQSLPDDWDIFFTGNLHIRNPIAVAPGIVSGDGAFGTHCYCIKGESLGKAAAVLDNYAEAVDNILSGRSHGLKRYFASPTLSWQLENISTVDGQFKPARL